VIISNAGYGLFGAAEELTDEQVEHIAATKARTGSARNVPCAGASSRAWSSASKSCGR
jgi:hypothetical protein